MPRKCASTYGRSPAANSNPDELPEDSDEPERQQSNVVVTPHLFARMADQMKMLTEGLALTKADVDQQKVGLATAKSDLSQTQAQLDVTKHELASTKVKNSELQRQLAAQDPKYSWNKFGNGEQFRFNCGILNTLTEAATAYEEVHYTEAQAFVRSGMEQVAHRNKIIKLADNSQVGWAFVEEYEQLDLADNPEDDHRIRRAELAAIAKKKRKLESSGRGARGGRGKSFRGRGGYSNSEDHTATATDNDAFAWFLQQCSNSAPTGAPVTTPLPAAPAAPAPAVPAYPRKQLGPCYFCGGPHLQSQCPAFKNHQAILKAHREAQNPSDGGTDGA
jgi:hypothetical protein